MTENCSYLRVNLGGRSPNEIPLRHKEEIIGRVGVDRFEIRRLTETERFFRLGGRVTMPGWPTAKF